MLTKDTQDEGQLWDAGTKAKRQRIIRRDQKSIQKATARDRGMSPAQINGTRRKPPIQTLRAGGDLSAYKFWELR